MGYYYLTGDENKIYNRDPAIKDAGSAVYTQLKFQNGVLYNSSNAAISNNTINITHEGNNFPITIAVAANGVLTITFNTTSNKYFGAEYNTNTGEWALSGAVGYEIVGGNGTRTTEVKTFYFNNYGYSYSGTGSRSFTVNLNNYTSPIKLRLLCNLCDGYGFDGTIHPSQSFVTLDTGGGATATWEISTHEHVSAPGVKCNDRTSTSITVGGGTHVRMVNSDGANITGYDWVPSPNTYTGLKPSTSYYFKTGNSCDCGSYMAVSGHERISTLPATPYSEDTTQHTIELATGRNNYVRMTNAKGNTGDWVKAPYFFEGLDEYKTYYFQAGDYYDGYGYLASDVIPITTLAHKAVGVPTFSNVKTKTMTITAGANGTYVKRANADGTEMANCSWQASPFTYDQFEPKTTYYFISGYKCNGCGKMIKSGVSHTTTKERFTVNDCSDKASVSATTLKVIQTWNEKGSEGISCKITCNNKEKTISTNGGYAVFTGLTAGGTYTVSYTVTDDEGNTSTGSYNKTTKKAFINNDAAHPITKTSRIIRFSGNSNYSSDTMQLAIDDKDWVNVNQNTTTAALDGLTHNTNHTLKCRIKDCYAYTDKGLLSSINDSNIDTLTIKTHELTLIGSVIEQHQHSLITSWQAKVNGANTDKDAIDGTLFTFGTLTTTASSATDYQTPNDNNVSQHLTSNPATTGVYWSYNADKKEYELDRNIYSNNLKWYYCKYTITANITDGYNTVAGTVDGYTTFPYSIIYDEVTKEDGTKTIGPKKAIPYIYNGSNWVPAVAFVHNGTKFKESNGE